MKPKVNSWSFKARPEVRAPNTEAAEKFIRDLDKVETKVGVLA